MRKYIIVDENLRPMSFDERDGQLCYTNVRGRSRFYLKTYTESEALKAIDTTITNRKKWNMHSDGDKYNLMPLAL